MYHCILTTNNVLTDAPRNYILFFNIFERLLSYLVLWEEFRRRPTGMRIHIRDNRSAQVSVTDTTSCATINETARNQGKKD